MRRQKSPPAQLPGADRTPAGIYAGAPPRVEHTPAELVADIFESGITLTGGGAQLGGLCEAIAASLKVDCHPAENPQECVARGCGLTLENWSEFGKFLGDRRKR